MLHVSVAISCFTTVTANRLRPKALLKWDNKEFCVLGQYASMAAL